MVGGLVASPPTTLPGGVYDMIIEGPPNSIVIIGEHGINELLTMVYDAWDKGVDYRLVFHLDGDHPEGFEGARGDDDCPKMIFVMNKAAFEATQR